MAQRTKYKYRGRTRTRASRRPGKRTVSVRAYCRRAARTATQRFDAAVRRRKKMGF